MSYRYDAYKQAALASPWHTTLNNFIGAAGADMDWAVGQIGTEENILWGVPSGLTYSDADTFTVTGDHTAKFAFGALVICDLGTDGLVSNEVASSSYGAGITTVELQRANLTSNLQCIYTLSTRPGTFPNRWIVNAADYGIVGDDTTDNSAALQAAIDSLSASGGHLIIGQDRYDEESIYSFDTPLVIPTSGIKLVQNPGTQLHYIGTGNAIEVTDDSGRFESWFLYLKGLDDATQAGAGLKMGPTRTPLVFKPTIWGFKYGIYVDASLGGMVPLETSMYGKILYPEITANPLAANSAGIYMTGNNAVSGKRPNHWLILGGSVGGAGVDGWAINRDSGALCMISGVALEGNEGWAVRLAGSAAYEQTACTIEKCWFEGTGTSLGSVYFDEYAVGNLVKRDNLFRTVDMQNFGGDWVAYNTIECFLRPNSVRPTGFYPYNSFSPNLAINGGFRLDSPVVPGVALGYSRWGTGGSTFELGSADPPLGLKSYQRIISTATAAYPRIYKQFEVIPGRLYNVGVWARTGVSQLAYLMVGSPSNVSRYGNTYNTANVLDTWEYLSLTVRVPHLADVADANILRITMQNLCNGVNTVDWAGLRVTHGSYGSDFMEHVDTMKMPLIHAVGDVHSHLNSPVVMRPVVLQASQMGVEGAIEIEWTGMVSGTSRAKQAVFYFGASVLCTLNFAAVDSTQRFLVRSRIENYTAANQRATTFAIKGTATDPEFFAGIGTTVYQAFTENTAAEVTIKATGEVIDSAEETSQIIIASCVVKPVTPWFDLTVGA
jgi:hypothetical protein